MDLIAEKLIQDLFVITQNNLKAVESLKSKSIEILNWKSDSKSWSVLECLEHLNRYGDFYIPEITKKIASSKYPASKIVKSNWLGKYFSKSVSYSKDLKKMKTFKSMNPIKSKLNKETIHEFITQQYQIIDLLKKAKKVSLDKTKTAISISKIIKLRLGDTFRVVIYHNERHVKQAEKVFKQAVKNTVS